MSKIERIMIYSIYVRSVLRKKKFFLFHFHKQFFGVRDPVIKSHLVAKKLGREGKRKNIL